MKSRPNRICFDKTSLQWWCHLKQNLTEFLQKSMINICQQLLGRGFVQKKGEDTSYIPCVCIFVWQRFCEPARLRIAYCPHLTCLTTHVNRNLTNDLSICPRTEKISNLAPPLWFFLDPPLSLPDKLSAEDRSFLYRSAYCWGWTIGNIYLDSLQIHKLQLLTLLRFSGVFSDPGGHKTFLILLVALLMYTT